MKHARLRTPALCGAFAFGLGIAIACGGSSPPSGFTPGPGNASSSGGGSGGGEQGDGSTPILGGSGSGGVVVGDGGCVGLQCQIHTCPNNPDGTTLTGHVYDPAGNNALYDVVVYVPNSTPAPITPGVDATSCSCDLLYTGEPIAAGITDASGSFTVKHVPDGTDIPLVVQIGKWRTQIKIPTVTLCGGSGGTNDLDTLLLPEKLKLPSIAGVGSSGLTKGLEQDIPNIAISTGSADTLECLLRRVGVDPLEYTPGAGGTGHIHIFTGGGKAAPSMVGSTPSDTDLWKSSATLSPYDIVLLSCEGAPTTISNVAATTAALQTYTAAGGRVFAEHYHYEFFSDPQSVFANDNIADWFNVQTPGAGGKANDQYADNSVSAIIQTTLPGGSAFPKGQALQTWLSTTVNAEVNGELPISVGRYNAMVTGTTYLATPWAQADPATLGSGKASTQYFSFDTPIGGVKSADGGAPNYCGRVVFSDLHVSGGTGSGSLDNGEGQGTVPLGCSAGTLQPDEDALEFMLFDLSSCVTPVTAIPQPPPTPQPPVK